MTKHLPKLIQGVRQAGFTMIELLIVISILGILAVAVLSAINPIEQINRGRDTGSQSDAEQLISAIDRYYASNGTYPWQGTGANASDYVAEYQWTAIGSAVVYLQTDTTPPPQGTTLVLEELQNADEIKNSFVQRVANSTNQLYLYYNGVAGNSVYACWKSQSKDFRKKAATRCGTSTGTNLPTDLGGGTTPVAPANDPICGTTSGTAWTDPTALPADADVYTCLP